MLTRMVDDNGKVTLSPEQSSFNLVLVLFHLDTFLFFSLTAQKLCEQYWPNKVGETLNPHNNLMVTLVSHKPFSDFIIHNFRLSKVCHFGVLSTCL